MSIVRNRVKRRFYTSRRMAKDRLKLLLAADRVQCSPEIMERLKEEMAATVSRYMEVDREQIKIYIQDQNGKNGRHNPLLCASVPLAHSGTCRKKT